MNFQYQIYVNGLPMDSKPTFNGAMAQVTKKWHSVSNVKVMRNGVLVWKSQGGK